MDHKTPKKSDQSPSKPEGSKTSPGVVGLEDIDMATGTAKDQAAGGGDSRGLVVHTIPRPITKFGYQVNVYTKVHKLMSFGIAPKIFVQNTNDNWLGTHLAEIPWELPVMYLNKSEFDLLPNGSRVESVSCKVYYRQSVIQFEKAATTSGIATLNQISDISVGHALNKTGWGSSVNYSGFDPNQPMIPTGVRAPRYETITGYRGLQQEFYGEDQSNANFTSYIPKHQTGHYSFIQNYWALSTNGRPALAGAVQSGGWPCIVEKYDQYDGKTVINTCVASTEYRPKVAPIKSVLRNTAHGLPRAAATATIQIPTGGHLPIANQCNFKNTDTTAAVNNNREISNTTINYNQQNTTFNIYTPIEKSQIFRTGLYGETDPHVQPSLHIGVQPIPALTTTSQAAGDGAYNAWTDTRGYFEVVCTMVVKSDAPTAYPYAATANVPIGDQMFEIPAASQPAYNKSPSDQGATWAGLNVIQKPTF